MLSDDKAQPVQSVPPTLSLMISAARKKGSFNLEDDEGHEDSSTMFSLRKLRRAHPSMSNLYKADVDSAGDLLAPEGVDRFRQLFAIRIIERHYTRHVRVRPGQLFLDEACTRQAEWGKLTFATRAHSGPGHPSRKQGIAYYMRVSHNSEAGRVARCIAKFWQVAKPSVIIAVTGGARGLRVSALHRKLFCEGLVAAAKATGAMIFTGGNVTQPISQTLTRLSSPL